MTDHPCETYRLFCVALLEENADDARKHYVNLRAWIEHGGFEPVAFSTSPLARRQFFTFNPRTGQLG
jgi:hypothetical protein